MENQSPVKPLTDNEAMPIQLLPAIITAISALGATAASAAYNKKQANDAQRFSAQQSELAYQRSTYKAQIADMQEAGINPNLFYGSLSAPSMSPASGVQAHEVDNPIQNYIGLRMLKAQMKQMTLENEGKEAQNRIARAEASYLERIAGGRISRFATENALNDLRKEGMHIANSIAKGLKDMQGLQKHKLEADIAHVLEDIALKQKDKIMKGYDIDLKALEKALREHPNMKGLNIPHNAPFWLQMTGAVVNFFLENFGNLNNATR